MRIAVSAQLIRWYCQWTEQAQGNVWRAQDQKYPNSGKHVHNSKTVFTISAEECNKLGAQLEPGVVQAGAQHCRDSSVGLWLQYLLPAVATNRPGLAAALLARLRRTMTE